MGKRLDQFAHFPDGAFELALAEEGGAANEGVGAGASAFNSSVEVDAAINFNVIAETFFPSPDAGLLDFGQHLRNERLPAKAGIHGHDEQLIDLSEKRLDVADSGGWIDGQADL